MKLYPQESFSSHSAAPTPEVSTDVVCYKITDGETVYEKKSDGTHSVQSEPSKLSKISPSDIFKNKNN